jgi:type VI secretion system protein ImpK
MNPLISATQSCFGAISQIRHLDSSGLPSPEHLHQRLCGFVDEMQTRLGEAGFHRQDIQDVSYAVVALVDEVALGSGEPLASYWMTHPLQFQYFRENTAGDGFFIRLSEIRKDSRRKEVLRAYGLCLLFGFQGKYRVRGGELELMSLVESVQRELARPSGNDEALSPHAERPNEVFSRAKGNVPLLLAAAGSVLAALLLYGGLRLSLSANLSSVSKDIAAATRREG